MLVCFMSAAVHNTVPLMDMQHTQLHCLFTGFNMSNDLNQNFKLKLKQLELNSW
jgi:hypothetical protein